MKRDEIKPPSIDEEVEESLTSLPTPMQDEPTPVFEPEKSAEISAQDELKENKDKDDAPTHHHNPKLPAPDIAKQYYIPRSGRIATKNISFKKNKAKSKHGKGGSPHAGSLPFSTDANTDKRQLPSRKSRPQQLLDSEQAIALSDDLFSQRKNSVLSLFAISRPLAVIVNRLI